MAPPLGTSLGWFAVQSSGIWGQPLGASTWVLVAGLDLPPATIHAGGDTLLLGEDAEPERDARVWRGIPGP